MHKRQYNIIAKLQVTFCATSSLKMDKTFVKWFQKPINGQKLVSQKNYMKYLDAVLLSTIALFCLVLKTEIGVLIIIKLLLLTPILILILIVVTKMFFKVSTCCNRCNLWIHLRQNYTRNFQGVADEKMPMIKSVRSSERSYDK